MQSLTQNTGKDLSDTVLIFGLAITPRERLEIFNLRESVYLSNGWMHLLRSESNSKYNASDEFDEFSFLFYLKAAEEIIASCRMLPLQYNPVFKENLEKFNMQIDLPSSVIIERLVVRAGFRNGQLYKKFLCTVCQWAKINTEYRHWFAKCHPKLTPLYLNFRGKKIGHEKVIDSRGIFKDYDYLKGNADASLSGNDAFILPFSG